MMFQETKKLSREYLANPHADVPYIERLIASGAVDLRDNHRTVDLGNGYVEVVPIDKTKLWTRESYDKYRQENPLTNAKDMLRKSMVKNNRTAEDVRRDLKDDPEVMRRARERE